MLMNKTRYVTIKFLSVLLSVLMLSVSFPFLGAAKELTPSKEQYYNEKTLSDFSSVEMPGTKCYSAFVQNLETGLVIYEKKSNDIVFPASTVKIMTAIVAFEHIPDLDVKITASNSAIAASKGTKMHFNMPIKEGESFSARDLLYSLLVAGANDSANVIAEYVGGSIEGFVDMMNNKAKELGAVNTVFKNPTGLHTEGMVTTAHDIAIIANYAYYNNTLMEMSSVTSYTIPSTELTKNQRVFNNRNRLLRKIEGESNYFYKDALGLSAGSTPEAGQCLVTTASRNGLTYLCVVMNAPEIENVNYSYIDTSALLTACFEKFANITVLRTKDIICEAPVSLAANIDHMTLFAEKEISALLPVGTDISKDIKLDKMVYDDYSAPIVNGTPYGELVVMYKDDIVLGKTNLVSQVNIDRSNFLYFLSRIEKFLNSRWFKAAFTSAAVLFVLYFLLSVAVKIRKAKRNGNRRR